MEMTFTTLLQGIYKCKPRTCLVCHYVIQN